MSNELDKLAAEMRKMKPSKTSRQGAMDAAMAAFSQEFSVETTQENSVEKTIASEKNATLTQGSEAAARPTGQTTRTTRVQTFGRQTMAKFNALTNFKPQTMMMAGTCAAALIAGLIVFPVMGDLSTSDSAVIVEPLEIAKIEQAETKALELTVQTPVEETKDAGAETARSAVEPRVEAVQRDQKPDPKAVDNTNTVGSGTETTPPPQTIIVERRVIKTPARTVERTVPVISKTETRRRIKTPAATLERSIPAITKEETREIEQPDGTFESVTETVVVKPASVEYVEIPPVYETYSETVTVQEASSELITIPQTFETVRETITVEADGTQTVVSSEVVPPVPSEIVEGTIVVTSAPTVQGGITSVESLLNNIKTNASNVEDENRQRTQAFKQPSNQPRPLVEALPAPPPALVSGGAPAPALPQISDGFVQSNTVISGSDNAPREIEKFAGLTLEVSPAEFKTVTETVVVQEASTELISIPAEYETVTETVVVTPQSVEYVVEPAEYEWIDGEIDGSTVEYVTTPAEYETYSETVVVQEASSELVMLPPTYETVQETVVVRPSYAAADGSSVPAITKEVSRRVVKTPARTQERTIPSVTKMETRRRVKTPAATIEKIVPYETKDGKTRVPVKPATVKEKTIAPVTKEVTRRVIKTPARTQERTLPSVPQTYERQVVVVPSKLYLRDDDGNVVREFESRDAFEIYKANLPTAVVEKPVSTFSVDVDTASYAFMRASINRGQLPPRASIRLEEMINYFPYDYDAPKSADEPFKANVTVTTNPWNADKKLMHIGIKGYVTPASERPRSNLVFLIDTSGSMNRANKLPLLINSFKLLLNTLDEDDTVSIVAYASASGTVLEPTRVKDKDDILKALNNLRAGGSTAGAAGLELAYQKAQENFDDEGVNRVILATDGDFNVGFSSPDDMKTFIQEKRETGIFLSVLGFGMGNYNDHLMQSLAQNGNGVAAYIDSLSEANKVLANEAGSALFTIAKDVKIQVEFNPATVAEYRLLGYETRALKRQDFNNDKVDAGEIGAGHTVTAIYEMTPVGSPAVTIDKLRYVSETPPTDTGSDEYAFVKIRHKLPNADKSTLQMFPIGKGVERSLKRASDDMRFATAVAIVGQKLRGDTAVEDYSYKDAIKLAKSAKGKDDEGYRAEFIQLVKLIETMEK